MPVKRASRVAKKATRAPKKAAAAAVAKECLISRLTPENLHDIFRRVDFHARREVLPLVCKTWAEAAGADSPVWDSCELSIPQLPARAPAAGAQEGRTMHWHNVLRWYLERASRVKQLKVDLNTHGGHDLTPSALGTLVVMLSRSLESLEIGAGSSRVFDASIWASVSLARKLRSLDFRGCALDFQKARQLARLTELRHLRLTPFGGVSAADTTNVGTLFKSLRKLESVSLTVDRRSPGVMAQDMFVFNTALTSLELVDFERPCGFEQLVGLKVLQLPGSVGADLNLGAALELSALTALTELDLSGNQLRVLPATVSAAAGLQALNLSRNPFINLDAPPTQLAGLTQLTRLDLSSCNLRRLPAAVLGFRRLRHLELRNNQLVALHGAPFVGSLEYLGLESNPIDKLCHRWAGAKKLRVLKIGGSGLTQKGFDGRMLRILRGMRQLADLRVTLHSMHPNPHHPHHHHLHHPHLAHHYPIVDAFMTDEESDLDMSDMDEGDPYGTAKARQATRCTTSLTWLTKLENYLTEKDFKRAPQKQADSAT